MIAVTSSTRNLIKKKTDASSLIPRSPKEIGSRVLAKIVDQRDIAQYLAHLLGGKKEEEIVPLTIAVDKIEIDQDNVKVYTRFSPRVVGLSCLCLQDKVKIIKKEKISFFKRFLKFF